MKTKINTQTYISLQKLLNHIESITPNLKTAEIDFLDNMDSLSIQYGEDMLISEKQEDWIDNIYNGLRNKISRLEAMKDNKELEPYNKERMKII